MKVWFIDHYDSFSLNLVDWLYQHVGVDEVYISTCDTLPTDPNLQHFPVVFSPGPKAPNDYPCSLKLLKERLGKVPVLGVCLGHQMIGALHGATISRGRDPFHGIARSVKTLPGTYLSEFGIGDFAAASYNSLVISELRNTDIMRVAALDADGEIQAVESAKQYGGAPFWGWQFHPESFLTSHAAQLGDALRKLILQWRS